MTVTRKFDGKNAKKLAETRIKNIEFFEKYSQNNFESIKDKNIIYATATENFEQAYIAVWGETAVIMEVMAGDTVETPIWDEYKAVISRYDSRGDKAVSNIERFLFYEEAKKAYAIIATGESALYANLILQKGVI